MNRGQATLLAVAILISASGAMAIYIFGLDITGYFWANSGAKETTDFDWDINITSNAKVSENFSYNNPDGVTAVDISFVDNVVSRDTDCTYQPGLDFELYINDGSVEHKLSDSDLIGYSLSSGNTIFNVSVVPHYNRCPLGGNYNVQFVVP